MANAQRPGFLPVSSAGTLVQRRFPVASNNTNAIRKGDAVVWTGAGMVRATTTNTAIAGPSLGASYQNSSGARIDSPVLPAATTYSGSTVFPADGSWIFLPDDVNTDLIGSIDDTATNADIMLNAAMVLNTTATRYSDHEVDDTGLATTATFPLRIVGFVQGPQSDADLADAAAILRVNAGFISPAMTTTGTA